MKTGDFANTFDSVKKVDQGIKVSMWLSAALMLAEVFAEKMKYENTTECIAAINSFILVLFLFLSFSRELLLFKAEQLKRLDLFDNSFGTKLSETHTEGYYSNDSFTLGYKKLALNNFESVFFTYRIMKEDLGCVIIKAVLICAIFILVAIFGLHKIFILLIQITLPITILVESIRYVVTELRVKNIYFEYRKLYEKKGSIRHVDILNQLIKYTATLTAGSVLLSDRTYNKLNASLSKEWEQIKKEFDIK